MIKKEKNTLQQLKYTLTHKEVITLSSKKPSQLASDHKKALIHYYVKNGYTPQQILKNTKLPYTTIHYYITSLGLTKEKTEAFKANRDVVNGDMLRQATAAQHKIITEILKRDLSQEKLPDLARALSTLNPIISSLDKHDEATKDKESNVKKVWNTIILNSESKAKERLKGSMLTPDNIESFTKEVLKDVPEEDQEVIDVDSVLYEEKQPTSWNMSGQESSLRSKVQKQGGGL